MARRPVINIATLSITAPNHGALVRSIDQFQTAEGLFYDGRSDELNSYPGLSGLTKSIVEGAYDSLLGTTPWNYTSVFNNAGNSLATESSTVTDNFGNDSDDFFVQLPSPLSSYATSGDNSDLILYKPGKGFSEVDLLYTNISFFTSRGSLNNEDDRFGYGINFYTGFGEVPIAYQNNSSLSGRLAHMYRLIGNRYDSEVQPKYSKYIDKLSEYNAHVGGGDTEVYSGGTADRPWDGYAGVFGGYNRPGTLSSNLVEESRGYN